MHCKSHESKLVQCTYCPKQVLTQSALAMHVKSHIFKSRLFHCLYCSERFQHATEIMGHVPLHMENGFYNCERCHKVKLWNFSLLLEIHFFFFFRNSKNTQQYENTSVPFTRMFCIRARIVDVILSQCTN